MSDEHATGRGLVKTAGLVRVRESGELTPRELQLVKLLVKGFTMKEIAAQMDISVKTADTHRHNAITRLSLRNNADLTRHAIRVGWIKLEEDPRTTVSKSFICPKCGSGNWHTAGADGVCDGPDEMRPCRSQFTWPREDDWKYFFLVKTTPFKSKEEYEETEEHG